MCELGYKECKHQKVLDMEDSPERDLWVACSFVYKGLPMGYQKLSKEFYEWLRIDNICEDCFHKKLKEKKYD